MKQNAIVVSYSQFAFGLGTQARLLRESSLAWHKEYAKADATTKADRRIEWLTNHLMGKLDIAQPVAERILSKSRTQRTKEQQAAYYRAYSDFSYHIIRPENTTSSTTGSAQVDEAEACLKMFYAMSKKNQARFDMLRAKDAGKK
jgi:hypothetical protein